MKNKEFYKTNFKKKGQGTKVSEVQYDIPFLLHRIGWIYCSNFQERLNLKDS